MVFIFYPDCTNRVFYESSAGTFLIGILFALSLFRIHWTVGLISLVITYSAFLTMSLPNTHYLKQIVPQFILPIAVHGIDSYVCFLSFAILYFILDIKHFRWILILLFYVAVIDSSYMIYADIIYGPKECYAMLSNSAMDASFIACLMPFSYSLFRNTKYKKTSLFLSLIMIIAIILSKSSTGIAAIGVAFGSYIFMEYGLEAWWKISALFFGITGFSWLYLRNELLNPNGRYNAWKNSLSFFWTETHHIIGAGVGTHIFWSFWIAKYRYPTAQTLDVFIWLHNSWLQALFELGIIGFISLILLYIFLIRASWFKKNTLFPILVTYGFIGITQMPLQIFPFQLLGACLIFLSFDKNEKCT